MRQLLRTHSNPRSVLSMFTKLVRTKDGTRKNIAHNERLRRSCVGFQEIQRLQLEGYAEKLCLVPVSCPRVHAQGEGAATWEVQGACSNFVARTLGRQGLVRHDGSSAYGTSF